MLIQYLIKQSRKPSGLVGRLITNIWSSYFKELSLWASKQTSIPNNSRILEVGYGGGSTIKNGSILFVVGNPLWILWSLFLCRKKVPYDL